ncbi:3D (Asp-Asp-Asp) domain-containing protein [Salinimicrobium sediminis]|uniref:3D (Asp-Asp-Asp) domain-containing protein n=1 Tax=Salinimicrobium sediminis TaxID=1343891 RepID=A0A285X5D8_9FLAO|nr:3D domain-containing protein [Salinimicrobium sediminis]SOC80226.1 3D (Asp-Asp-Asp) domain-containing protein [Salinimicrobium sediminis]
MLVLMISEKLIFKFLMLPLFFIGGFGSCEEAAEAEMNNFEDWQTITVTASAYNSLKIQGQGNPEITAWGDTLAPDVLSIAVSRDLIKKGLKHNTPVIIEGFEGIFIVNDKMHPRWRNKIDIYMGEDKEKALKWGRRKVQISYPPIEPPGE